MPVAEHHDGFAMYDSGLTDWTAVEDGAEARYHRGTGEGGASEGLHFGASSHRVEHDFFLGGAARFSSDVNDPQYAAFYGPAHTWLDNKPGTPLYQGLHLRFAGMGDDWLARRRKSSKSIIPTSCISTGGSASLRCGRISPVCRFYYNSSFKYGDHVGVINYKDYAMQEHLGGARS